jgi:flavin reductase (DIM6/NTAB) family NADH-FMN oxidoreductase RutF
VFSSNRKVADNTTKDTLHNAEVQKELVINMVSYNIVRQMAISSVSYPTEVSEFEKSGLTPEPSELVNAPRVAESPVNMECLVKEIIPLGDQGGAGHLIICEILMLHIDEEVLDGNRIDPHKIDLMGRMGRSYYVRASGTAISSIYQSVVEIPIGYDGLPEAIRKSNLLSANDIATIAGLTEFPEAAPVIEGMDEYTAHQRAKELIAAGNTEEALALLLSIV